jgi:hypothetical protein
MLLELVCPEAWLSFIEREMVEINWSNPASFYVCPEFPSA